MGTDQNPPKLTMMDEYARRAMLSYSTIYPNRLRMLCHMFLTTGNAIDWEKDGTISCDHYNTEMDFQTVDDRRRKHIRESLNRQQYSKSGRPPETETEIGDFFDNVFRESAVKEYQDQIWVSEHIYELATARIPANFQFVYNEDNLHLRELREAYQSHTIGARESGGHYEEAKNLLSSIKSGYATLANIPERVEKSFFEAALEILDAVIRSTKDIDQRSELEDYRDLLVATKKPYDGGLVTPATAKPLPETIRSVTIREDGRYLLLKVNGQTHRKFKEYSAAAEWVERTFKFDEPQMEKLYLSYRKDRERQERMAED